MGMLSIRHIDGSGVDCSGDKPITKQADKPLCDINNIMRKYQQTGLVSHVNKKQPLFGDVSKATDYHTASNIVIDANKRFMELPAFIRKRFDNDPGKLVMFLSDAKNVDEAVKLGLVVLRKEPSSRGPLAPPAVVPPK